MKTLKIKFLADFCDCETCGPSYAEGYRVTLEDEVVFEFEPVAHCYNNENCYERDMWAIVFEKLGYKVEFDES